MAQQTSTVGCLWKEAYGERETWKAQAEGGERSREKVSTEEKQKIWRK